MDMNYDLSESSVLVHILLSIDAQSSPRALENIGCRAGSRVTGQVAIYFVWRPTTWLNQLLIYRSQYCKHQAATFAAATSSLSSPSLRPRPPQSASRPSSYRSLQPTASASASSSAAYCSAPMPADLIGLGVGLGLGLGLG